MSRQASPPRGQTSPGDSPEDSKQIGHNKPRLLANWISLTGLGVMLVGIVTSLFFLLMELVSGETAPYMGIVYLLLLCCILAGMILVPFGMLIRRRKIARKAIPPLPAHPWLST